MGLLRKIALGLLLAVSAAVLLMAAVELSNYRDWASFPVREPALSAGDRARLLQDRIDFLSRRVGDMELLVLILLGTSGLYAIVFVASSYLSATSFARQADRTIEHIQDEIGVAMGNLRELQEQTEQKLRAMTAPPRQIDSAPPVATAATQPPMTDLIHRIAALAKQPLTPELRRKLIEEELAFTRAAANDSSVELPNAYLSFGVIFADSDRARSRFYLDKALALAKPDSGLASEIHYELACHFARSHDFMPAIRELTAAFEHQSKALDARLAADLEEGGKLYELAATEPFDKAVNDLLLNVSI